MTVMHLEDGTSLAEPIRRAVHGHGWQWAREGRANCTCFENVYPNPGGGERMFLHTTMGDNTSDYKIPGVEPYPVAEYLFAVVNHYLNNGWRMEHCDSKSAVLVSVVPRRHNLNDDEIDALLARVSTLQRALDPGAADDQAALARDYLPRR